MSSAIRRAALIGGLAAGLAGCMDGGPAPASPAAPAVPPVTVVGAAVDCVPLHDLRESHVRNDSTIDFISPSSRKGWRNTLPAACSQLGFERRFSYETSLTQLCSSDIIYVLQDYGGSLRRGAACGLGQFVPVEFPK